MESNTHVIPLAESVRTGKRSVSQIAEEFLSRIERMDSSLHAFLHVDPDRVRTQARALDAKRARGESLGPLAGVPLAIKDALVTRGVPTTSGSKILQGYLPPYDATVVTRLEEADALLVGKTNMDEFAMGSSNENSAYGPVRNPWDATCVPGGSSGGSAAAVAARLALAALGSDTGGSIRQPASFCGVVGVKPTYGRVSRYGLIAFASSLDQVGPFATDVRGAARVLEAISGHDPRDSTSLPDPVERFEEACERSPRGLRIGVPEEYFAEGLDPEVEASVRAALRRLEQDGCIVKKVKLPHTRFAVATYYVLASAEASSNLSRFDGIRYGLRVEPWTHPGDTSKPSLSALYKATRAEGFGPEVKRRILLGTFVLSSGYYDAYYRKAQQVRTLIRRDFDTAFGEVDLLCSPTSPTAAFPLGAKIHDPLAMYLSDLYTLPASLAGLPALSLPCGQTSQGLPIGLQILAPALQEASLFTLAAAWETHSPPPLPPVCR